MPITLTPRSPAAPVGLVSGAVFNAAEPETWNGTWHDISTGLENTCRFGGQVTTRYNVAQHCILVRTLITDWGCPLELQIAGLLHDAHEGIYGDIITPLKPIVGLELHNIIHRFDAQIAAIAGIDPAHFHHQTVKHADDVALHIEAARLTTAPWPRPYPYDTPFPPCHRERGGEMWLDMVETALGELAEVRAKGAA